MSGKDTAIILLVILVLILGGTLAYLFVAKSPSGGPYIGDPLPPPSEGVPPGGYAPDQWKSFRDGDFDKETETYNGYQFSYPRDFELVLGPDTIAGGYLSVGTARLQLGFPADAFQSPRTNFANAFITVSKSSNPGVVPNCLRHPDDLGKTLTDTRQINGVIFYHGRTGNVAAGNFYEADIYRTVFSGACYEVALTLHTTNIGNYEPGAVQEFDKSKAFAVLEQILNTFRLTDVQP